jgi:hypothetical protein
MIVQPDSGPVGTTVFIEGRDCDNSSQSVADISFDSNAAKTGLPQLSEDAEGYFSYSWTIAAQALALVGSGNQPGSYQFDSHPPSCQASFTATP